MEKKELKTTLENVMTRYAETFRDKYFGTSDDGYWVNGIIGVVYYIHDYYFSFLTIRYAVDHSVDADILFGWYDYVLEAGMISEDIPTPSLEQWVKGDCKVLSKERLEELKRLQRRVHEAEEALKESIRNELF